MEGIDHIDVAEVGGRGFVGDVDRVFQRQVPDRKGFELRVAGLHTALELMVDLRKAGRHFPGVRAGAGDHHDRPVGLDIIVRAVSLRAHDRVEIGRISFDRVVGVDADAATGQLGAHLLLRDVAGVDADHDVDLVLHALKEFDLGIRIEPRQDARGMEVAEEFAAEFEVKLVVELTGPLEDGLGLFT